MNSLNNLPTSPADRNKNLLPVAHDFPEKQLASIPPDILEVLWFKNGPFANYTPRQSSFKIGNLSISAVHQNEPSLIDVTAPIDPDGPPLNSLDIGVFPSYARLTPRQRFTYLHWLTDITKSISTGYVFLFYYGLERHLFFGETERAIKIISVLRKHHPNISFLVYSADASFLAIAQNKRLDLLSCIDFEKSSVSIRLFLRASGARQLLPDDILSACTLFGFKDTRFLDRNYELFKATLTQKLEEKFSLPYYPVESEDIAAVQSTFTAAVANYSLLPEERFVSLPNITSSPALHSQINRLLHRSYVQIKPRGSGSYFP